MISVCIATYNGDKYIEEQILSILNQLSDEDEIIISDDGSKDKTLKVIDRLNDGRIQVFKNNNRHGVVPNFENALKHASGEYIFFSDQDDIWKRDKVKICIDNLYDSDLVVHNSIVKFQDGEQSDMDFFELRKSGIGFIKNITRNTFVGSCMAFRRNVIDYILPFPKHVLWHDMWIGLMIEMNGKTKFIDNKLLIYRRHGDNASPTSEKSSFSKWFQFKYRLQILYYTIIRTIYYKWKL